VYTEIARFRRGFSLCDAAFRAGAASSWTPAWTRAGKKRYFLALRRPA